MTAILILLSSIQLAVFTTPPTINRFAERQGRCGVLRGRVVDSNRAPVDGVSVFALALSHPPNMESGTIKRSPTKKESFHCRVSNRARTEFALVKRMTTTRIRSYQIFRGDWKNSIAHISAGETLNDFEVR